MPTFLELEWLAHESVKNGTSTTIHVGVWPTELRRDSDYFEIYGLWCNVLILGAIPMILLMFLNVLIVHEMKTIKHGNLEESNYGMTRKKQIQMANIHIIVVIIFIICHVFRQIPSIHELCQRSIAGEKIRNWAHKDLMYTLTEISQMLVVLNSSVNCYIYAIKRTLWKKQTLPIIATLAQN